ncbi:MAG: polyprenyl synthetase family protein [Clostridia bacterium]|nr:polyprenyl synthetase family protein [Clostridia bacterium]
MLGFQEKYGDYLNKFNGKLDKFCSELTSKPSVLSESMKYSLLNGGKRIRPVLMYAVGDLIGADEEVFSDYALSLELIHTYSLIHDDLPEMDNDDYRRGKLTCHKVFGTGNAVLAGDGLLNTAYSILFNCCKRGREYTDAAGFVCKCAGIGGMIGGQSADLYCENNAISGEEWLEYIVLNKTAKLITAAVAVPPILKGGKYFLEFKQFGEDLGKLFQIVDDILDVQGDFGKLGKTIGKDKEENKLTYVTFYGIDKSRFIADVIYDKCIKILEGIDGDTEFLKQLTEFVRHREV